MTIYFPMNKKNLLIKPQSKNSFLGGKPFFDEFEGFFLYFLDDFYNTDYTELINQTDTKDDQNIQVQSIPLNIEAQYRCIMSIKQILKLRECDFRLPVFLCFFSSEKYLNFGHQPQN